MDRTADFEAITAGRCNPARTHYRPMNETSSLLNKIQKMKTHLNRYGHDYLNTYGYLPYACVMTDERRNKLDIDVERFIDSCHEKIKILQSEIRIGTESQQVIDHREAALGIVKKILNNLFAHFNHLRTTKIVRQMDKQRFDRIESNLNTASPDRDYEHMGDGISIENLSSDLSSLESINKNKPINLILDCDNFKNQSLIAAEHHTSIDPGEIQQLALENSRIHDDLMTLDDEVKLIGRKVVQISKLQEIFTEKVMEQAVDLDNLHETAIRSSENVREGNDLIRDAMMKNASTRVFILFYIITLGFTILFLDWYNP